MSQRLVGVGLLAAALFAAAFGLWRTFVWKADKAGDYWVHRLSNEDLAVLDEAVERQRKTVAAPGQGGSAKGFDREDAKLKLLQSEQFNEKANVTLSSWAEAAMALVSGAAALCLGSMGWRRWQPNKKGKGDSVTPAEGPPA